MVHRTVPIALLILLGARGQDAKPPASTAWRDMNYGPFLSATITAPSPKCADPVTRGNTAMKGIAVNLGDESAVCFDTDLLRLSAGWSGGFLKLLGTPFDGAHGPCPQISGTQSFGTRPGPGWARGGVFKDPRPQPFGPLPAEWGRYRGLYLHGSRAVFSYTVGACPILELPGHERKDENEAFTRTFRMGPSTESLTLLVCETDAPATDTSKPNVIGNLEGSFINAPKGSQWKTQGGLRLELEVPPLSAPVVFKLVLAGVGKSSLFGSPAEDPEALTHGGPASWTESLVTKGALGADQGPYAVDTITIPFANPYKSWMRLGGFDFFADGTRAAVSTWSGDVWLVSGIDKDLGKLTWKRFATGLHQPLGLKIVDDVVYTLGRDQITRLHDLNKDGEADFYENFNSDCIVTPNFHEFALDLNTDPEGNFYYAKAAPVVPGGRGFDLIAPHHGCVLKISRDGRASEVLATGFRAPNGMSVGPNGEVTSGDNEGTWTPSSRINLIQKGGFYGVVDTAHRSKEPTDYDRPVCWIPHTVDNSCGGQAWVTTDQWGPFKGHLLHISYGMCKLFKVLMERVGSDVQGGVVAFPLQFDSGIMRGRFNPKDGQLYVCGLKGWQTNGARDGTFQRVRYTGKPVTLPLEMRVTKQGIEITFASPLDPASAADPDNYSLEQWNYRWTKAYGSGEYSVADPNKLKRDPVELKSATLSKDGRTVSLTIPDLQPVMQMKIAFKLKAADGAPVSLEIYNTIHRIP